MRKDPAPGELMDNPIIDTHAHLCDPVFDADRKAVLERARGVGVTAVITVSENPEDARRNLELAEDHPMLRPAAGLYPTHLDPGQAEEMSVFIRENRRRLVCVGEVGLDRWAVKEEEGLGIQRAIFSAMIRAAREVDLPLNVHSRSAGKHAVAQLLEEDAKRVQLHAFDGKASAALPAVEAGYFFSIPPSIVRSRQKQKLVRHLPLSCLLLESDSPVLGPEPGERNEPANVPLAAEAVAEIKGVPLGAVLEAAYGNTLRLYGKPILSP